MGTAISVQDGKMERQNRHKSSQWDAHRNVCLDDMQDRTRGSPPPPQSQVASWEDVEKLGTVKGGRMYSSYVWNSQKYRGHCDDFSKIEPQWACVFECLVPN